MTMGFDYLKLISRLFIFFENHTKKAHDDCKLFPRLFYSLFLMTFPVIGLAWLSGTHFAILLIIAACIFVSGYIFSMHLGERVSAKYFGLQSQKIRKGSDSDVTTPLSLSIICLAVSTFFQDGNILFLFAFESLVFIIGIIFGFLLSYLFNFRRQTARGNIIS